MPQWLTYSGAGALLITPLLAFIGIAGRFVGAANTLFWHTSGLALGCLIVSLLRIPHTWNIAELRPTGWSCALLVSGLTLGVLANFLLFKGSALAPNPGLAFVVSVSANFLSVPVGAGALWLAHRSFGSELTTMPFGTNQCLGLLFVLIGVWLFVRF